ncbi:hypothetical protein BKP45_03300 [Anaerobacillus alkalidiazotrophicus]|uniref:non-specific serine/threonine protein kinase n=1 Tax=Anaerobacillus alkalidiazotrophicus TaxID=472963 RepID=A0A1S2MAK9_9BACI|nr:serine/threonine-protein kinase [Anaerobacillus alkalidiazotrophicus]OIJ21738.1 hypothetical protein BKP45_03300 [Anaerobacillus alkalidiazotrophicus]
MGIVIGQVFDGKYKIMKQLGEGGMGTVFLGEHVSLGTNWAIKRISKHTNDKIDLLAEPNIMKKLNHPSLPRIFDIIEDQDFIYIVLDYVEGITLEEELEKKKKIPEKTVVKWAKEICDVLEYLHTQKPNPIIYRDMKPSNLMITKDGSIKVIDFGIAREYKKESKSDTTYIGTRGYAAPEQYGTAQTDARTDIYSLGVTLYHLVTGKGPNDPPYEIKPLRELDSRLSVGLEHIILKSTRQDPKERYGNVKLLLKDFENIHTFSSDYKKARRKKIASNGAFVVSLAFFSFLTVGGVNQLQIEKIEAYEGMVEAGNELLLANQFDEAKHEFEKAIEKIPTRIDAYRDIAQTYLLQNEFDRVIEYVSKEVLPYVDSEHLDSSLFYVLATALFENSQYEEAASQFMRAYDLDRTNLVYERDYAVSLARAGMLEEAEAILVQMVERNTADEVTLYVKGEIFQAQENIEEAIGYYRQTIEEATSEAIKERTIITLAQLYKNNRQKLGNESIDDRITILNQGIDQLTDRNFIVFDELLAEAYYDKAMISKGEEREFFLKESVKHFEQLLSYGYIRPYLMRNIAIIYQLLGEYEQSETTLLDMQERYPQDYRAYLQLALLYAEIENEKPVQNRDYSRVIANYELALQNSPEGETTQDLLPLVNLIAELKQNNWIE